MKDSSRTDHARQFSVEWTAAIACFVIAGISGTAFRLVAAGFEPLSGLNLDYVRNAHSHLMLFSWATPPLMVLMTQRLMRHSAQNIRLPQFRRIIRAAILVGALTFVPFLMSGYTNTQIGPISLPLTIIFSTGGMFVWYAFAFEYARARRGLKTDTTWRLWDIATACLVICTAGAWARGALMGMKITDLRLTHGSIQFFVITFSFGWLALGLLGEFHRRSKTPPTRGLKVGTSLLTVGIPLVFLSAPMGEVPGWLKAAGHISSLLVGLGLGLHVFALWRARRGEMPAPSLIALTLVSLAMLGAALPPVLDWANLTGLRLIFVHLLLLGVVTLGLLEVRPRRASTSSSFLMPAAVVILLATMLPTTGLWPSIFYGPSAFYLVALGSTAPWLAAALLLLTATGGQTRPNDGHGNA